MNLKDIASISGKGGLFKVVKPTRTGVILEALDKEGKKFMAGPNSRVSILNEISIYTTDSEGAVPLEEVLKSIHKKEGGKLSFDNATSEAELRNYLEEVLPTYDADRVYASDLKKLVSWYNILFEFAPDIFKEEKPKKETAKKEEKSNETKEEKATATKKTTTKKAASKKED